MPLDRTLHAKYSTTCTYSRCSEQTQVTCTHSQSYRQCLIMVGLANMYIMSVVVFYYVYMYVQGWAMFTIYCIVHWEADRSIVMY